MDKLIELKAQAYDCLAAIEFNEAKLKQLNAEILKEMEKPKLEAVKSK